MATNRPRRRAARRIPSAPEPAQKQSGRRTVLLIAAAVLITVGVVIGVGYYALNVAPFQTAILKVNDETITADYFLRRVRYGGLSGSLMSALQVITEEELIRQGAPKLVGDVTPGEIDEALRETARGENDSISEVEFKAWYRDQLNESKLSKAEYRELVRTSVLASRLQEFLAARMPTVTEQVHLHFMAFDSYEDGLVAQERLDAGEDFATVALELSVDPLVSENRGDIGWLPEAVLPGELSWVFGIEAGAYSPPVTADPEGARYAIYFVSEREAAREIPEEMLPAVRSTALRTWLDNEAVTQSITWHGRDGENKDHYGSKTEDWLRYRLSNM